jgi:hypothetical protein
VTPDIPSVYQAEVVIVGATPSGITAAIAAARKGCSVVLLERTSHIGGLPANGLGATDIATRGVAGGLFQKFVGRIRRHYEQTYGEGSTQVELCSDGFHFEPSVAERVLGEMLAEHPGIEVRTMRQFDALPASVEKQSGRIASIRVTNRASGAVEVYSGDAFIDATYEGDLAAAAGVPYTTRREGLGDYHEPLAGRVYREWGRAETGEGSTGEGDDTIQAYNFRLCLTDQPANRVPVPKPDGYNRDEYRVLLDQLKNNRWPGVYGHELEWDGIGRVTNIVELPNGKTDANNQHLALVSTDLPVENYPWPTADWAWRDRFQVRLQNYILGILWFIQNDPEVPESFRKNASRYGLAADEYTDNGNFPRQVYVREGRRIIGERCFLAHDALPVTAGARPPIHSTSVTASHYAVDSHAVRKYEPGRVHLDGFLSMQTKPYTVPYGVMVPKTIDNLWVPVAVSSSHLGLGTIRMEPCWMALGEAAGTAAVIAIGLEIPARAVPIAELQRELVSRGAVVIYYQDVAPGDPLFPVTQYLGLRNGLTGWGVDVDALATNDEFERWCRIAGIDDIALPRNATRRDALLVIGTALGLNGSSEANIEANGASIRAAEAVR